jgi:hypothetical protein
MHAIQTRRHLFHIHAMEPDEPDEPDGEFPSRQGLGNLEDHAKNFDTSNRVAAFEAVPAPVWCRRWRIGTCCWVRGDCPPADAWSSSPSDQAISSESLPWAFERSHSRSASMNDLPTFPLYVEQEAQAPCSSISCS